METIFGGAGFIGAAICRELEAHGHDVTVVDVRPPKAPTAHWIEANLLSDQFELPPGRLVLANGISLPRVLRPWTLVLENALATARIALQADNQNVLLLSSVEVYGSACAPLRESTAPLLPLDRGDLYSFVDRLMVAAARGPASPADSYAICQELVALANSPRWLYGLSKLVQEEVLRRTVSSDRLTILRLANVVGAGQHRLLGHLVENALNGSLSTVTNTVRSFVSVEEVARTARIIRTPGVFNVASGSIALTDIVTLVADELRCEPEVVVVSAPPDDSCGVVDSSLIQQIVGPMEDIKQTLRCGIRSIVEDAGPVFSPPLPVVIPPRPERPDLVSRRMSSALWSGQLRGAAWTSRLVDSLREQLDLRPDDDLIPTCSGTAALRLAIAAVAGQPEPGRVALCPAYTFHATVEVLTQLGWQVRLVDVDPDSWTLAPLPLTDALRDPNVGLVVTVDALGNPSDYRSILEVCRAAGVPLVADSAPALGARYDGRPVGTQANAHAFSMSFAKTVSAGGAGGAVVLRDGATLDGPENWLRSSPMTELAAIAAFDNLSSLELLIERREAIAQIYQKAVLDFGGFLPQTHRSEDRHARVHWAMRVPGPFGLHEMAAQLARAGISTRPYYEMLATAPSSPTPAADQLHREVLALPMSSELSVDDAERVVVALKRVLRRAGWSASALCKAGALPDQAVR